MSAKNTRGKRVTLYLRDDDREKVRQLVAGIAAQGERVSESLIVRAAIHAAKPGRAFHAAYREVADADLRFRKE